jgi:hypothetical protein
MKDSTLSKGRQVIIACDICYQPIARAHLTKLTVPPHAEQFDGIDNARDLRSPFLPGTEWADWHCPHCRYRPFMAQDSVSYVSPTGALSVYTIPGGE